MNYNEFSEKIKTKYPQYKDMDNKALAQKMVAKYPQYSDVTFDEQKPGLLKRGWQVLGRPEQMSRQGLEQIAQMIPEGKITGNLPADLARGTPRILANTMAKAAPGFVNRGSLLGMGALGGIKGLSMLPKVRGAAAEFGGQLESAAGSPSGTLAHGFESAKNFFGAGKKAAGPIYESARPFTTHPELKDVFENKQLIEKSLDLAKKGNLSPFEAFNARKAVSSLFGKSAYSEDVLNSLYKTFDDVAKTDSRIQQGDQVFQTGLKNQSLRGILPKNKYGSTSAFKTGVMAAVPGAGWALSPIVQGASATGLGGLTRLPPELAALISSLFSRSPNQSANPETGQ
jgi:hypothetical protein